MPYIAKKDLIEAFALWIGDARDRPDDFNTYEETDRLPVEELAEDDAEYLLSLIEEARVARG